MAVDPHTGQIAVVYPDQVGPSSAIELVSCPPAFSGPCKAPVVINDVGYGQRLLPAVAIDNLGMVHVSWYDSRNAATDPLSSMVDIYATYARSLNHSFHTNARVTQSTIDFSNRYFIGDYSGMAASHGVAHPAWTDGLLKSARLLAPHK